MAATKMFLIRWYSSSTHLNVDLLIIDMYFCVLYKGFSDLEDFWDDLHVSRLKYNALDDFQKVFQTTSISVVWTSWKSSGLHGNLLTKSPFHNRSKFFRSGFDMQVFQIWKTSGTTYLRLSGSLPDDFHFSRLDFLKVVWTSWRSSGSRLDFLEVKSSGLPRSRLDFLKSSDKVFFHIKWSLSFFILIQHFKKHFNPSSNS
ncbi:hypothetical protein IGI04_015378 [Brassica rapa subsp. trilocularis]|uniref:DUF4283 domain-containing protein n=1 Tax=Brassica rapa subsp. trilocularis TaxID=1813537 RepID=A0ABQ7MPV3_BRACM|nr:hypothetical protein IGI04_015378 [Brassica rapa subsp. trilocularis]